MTAPKLPEGLEPALPPALEALMPEPEFRLRWHSISARYTVSKPDIGDTAVYTATQMREAILAATERAAKVCEERATAYRTTRAPGWNEVDHECAQCAAAIRSGQT